MSEKFRDGSPLDQIVPDQAGEGERACNDFVGIVGQTQQHEGDQSNRDLDANCIFGSSQEVADL